MYGYGQNECSVQGSEVQARVEGSSKPHYEVVVTFLPRPRFPGVEATCTCPDAATRRLCKHAVAVCYAVCDLVDEDPGLLKRLVRTMIRNYILPYYRPTAALLGPPLSLSPNAQ